ncbi:MAG TPA: hypothetical protein VMY69_07215 [Phycisphaerae bacterium]|nr:hypothetical protein [Phycisphaerae bacterium]
MAEQTALEKMRKFQDAATAARMQLKAATNEIDALAAGTNANIDNLVVRLLPEGQVCIRFAAGDTELALSERQFLGLMGWGRKHVGEGPNGKENGE